jgi:hypothetical protein
MNQKHLPTSQVLEESPHQLNRMTIFRLLSGFKLQQYANKMGQFGFKQEVYKLAFLSHRERDELITNLNMLPGHA